MDHTEAVSVAYWINNPEIKFRRSVQFVTPVLSSMLAALKIQGAEPLDKISFSENALGYARSNGLLDSLNSQRHEIKRTGLVGRTYSQLTRLETENDVDFCNSIINDVIDSKLKGHNQAVVNQFCKVVGELHDNVVSHACGAGFSAAQVYERKSESAISFAVADAGCGMLKSIEKSKLRTGVQSHGDAIRWCLERGNTTAGKTDEFAQYLPEDFSGPSPFPQSVRTSRSRNNHMGEGLWKLRELINLVNGKFWVLTGNSEYTYENVDNNYIRQSSIFWPGVVIEFEIPIPYCQIRLEQQRENFEVLAKELGL